jgi:hypothetical protein
MSRLLSAPNGFGRGGTLPEGVRRTAAAYGAAGLAWLNGLDHLIRGLERDWDVIVGRPLQGGSCAYVAETNTRAGTAVVIKLGIPSHESLDNEIGILQAANGRGYVRALARDPLRQGIERAVSLNRLTGVDLQPIWPWGLIERVSTGLYALQMGAEHTGLEMSKVADEWTKPGGDSPR